MPDVWTTNPEHMRDALLYLGAKCPAEARIITPRDTEWTCHADGGGYIRDIYIHYVGELYWYTVFLSPLVIALCGGVIIGLLWGRRFWRKALKSQT
jgi:hypothetical protein